MRLNVEKKNSLEGKLLAPSFQGFWGINDARPNRGGIPGNIPNAGV
jgi:hypothetical protein